MEEALVRRKAAVPLRSVQSRPQLGTSKLFNAKMIPGSQGIARRSMPLIAENPTRVPDHISSAPDLSLNEQVRARLLWRMLIPFPC
jgi:hypothetical protein